MTELMHNVLEQQVNSTTVPQLDFPYSDLGQLIPMIVINIFTIGGILYFLWKVWFTFKKRTFLSITMVASLFFNLITQCMVAALCTPIPLTVKDQLSFYKFPINYVSNFFNCASVLIRFYSLIPSMSQFCCIGNQRVYRIITYLLGGYLVIVWGASLFTLLTQALPTTVIFSLIGFYILSSLLVELIVATILLYLVLKTRRAFLNQMSIWKYLMMNYKPILVHIMSYIISIISGIISAAVDFNNMAFSYSFVRLMAAICEGWYYIFQVWFLILIRDTSENMANQSVDWNKTQNKSSAQQASKDKK